MVIALCISAVELASCNTDWAHVLSLKNTDTKLQCTECQTFMNVNLRNFYYASKFCFVELNHNRLLESRCFNKIILQSQRYLLQTMVKYQGAYFTGTIATHGKK